MLALFATLLALTLGEASRERRALRREMQVEREQIGAHGRRDGGRAAHPGRDAAARRRVRATTPRLDLAATMVPAREVGGDLYDFFRLDERRLFFLVGDVAGKGLSASIFMACRKALAKSAAVRHPDDDVGAWMTTANREISRDNREGCSSPLFAGILDLDTGDLVYCNAGHDAPYCVGAASGLRRLDAGDGPPLCTVDDYEYRGEHTFLDPGELVVLATDGVTDMRDAARRDVRPRTAGGAARGLRARSLDAHAAVDALRADVQAFAAGAEPADDLTVLALRWLGRRPETATGR